jgi:hypothetical protein
MNLFSKASLLAAAFALPATFVVPAVASAQTMSSSQAAQQVLARISAQTQLVQAYQTQLDNARATLANDQASATTQVVPTAYDYGYSQADKAAYDRGAAYPYATTYEYPFDSYTTVNGYPYDASQGTYYNPYSDTWDAAAPVGIMPVAYTYETSITTPDTSTITADTQAVVNDTAKLEAAKHTLQEYEQIYRYLTSV